MMTEVKKKKKAKAEFKKQTLEIQTATRNSGPEVNIFTEEKVPETIGLELAEKERERERAWEGE
jgi:hypothetical protein